MDALNEKSFSRKDKLTLQIAIYWKYIFFSVESFFFVSVFAPTAYDIANKFSIFAYYTLKQTHTLVLIFIVCRCCVIYEAISPIYGIHDDGQ